MALLPGVQMVGDPAGNINRNLSVAAQSPAAATRTQILGSLLKVPPGGLKVGTLMKWEFNLTKTAAGVAASTYDISFGTLGTVADTARVSFTKPAGDATADEARVIVVATVRTNSATGVVVGSFTLTHNLASTGHATIPVVNVKTTSGAFDTRGEDLYVALNVTSGAADALTIDRCEGYIQRPA